MTNGPIFNKTLDLADLAEPGIRPTATSLRRWAWRWLIAGQRLGVNGHVKRRCYIRSHKLWEYARGLALTGASIPQRRRQAPMTVLDVGGAMTAPLFYLAGFGDRVVSLDIDADLAGQTQRVARRRGLSIDARTTNLAVDDPTAGDLSCAGGFDRIYCFCVIEHIPPPGQAVVARRMGALLKPGGQMCLTFDYGENAPTEAPLATEAHVQAIERAVDLPLMGETAFNDNGRRFALDRKHPQRRYTFGSLFFHRPA